MENNYEGFRKQLAAQLLASGVAPEAIEKMIGAVDNVAGEYAISHTGKAITTAANKWERAMKEYICCCGIEGMSDKTMKQKAYILRNFFQNVRKDVDLVTLMDARAWLYRLMQDGLEDASRDIYRIHMHSFYAWAAKEGWSRINPFEEISPIKCEKKEREALTEDEVEKLRGVLRSDREKAIVEFMLSTGCRVEEMANLRKENIDMDTGAVHLFGKGKKHRTSRMSMTARKAMADYLAGRKDDCPFAFVNERGSEKHPMTTRMYEVLCERFEQRLAGSVGAHITPHVLRHTFATFFYEASKGDVLTLQRILGHEKTDTTAIYATVSKQHLMEAHAAAIG